MKITIDITEDVLALIPHINFKKLPDLEEEEKVMAWGIDFFSLYGGNFLLEDISMILGIYDRHIIGTESDSTGPKFNEEDEKRMLGVHFYILENIEYIESLIHYYIDKGGLHVGKYRCKDYEKIWEEVK